ncbi:MAG: putative glycosyl hydrolase, partial [Verrucomicrobiales bacterium]|nr:putative glycosyl hydrolase [Verrucomicrobiales bacterium]
GIMKEVAPESKLCVWSDMFDPNHNAHGDYYLVRGNLAGSWEGLPKEVLVVPWLYEKRKESLQWFSNRGHEQIIAGYYDHRPEQIANWLSAAEGVKGVTGYMYTTWEANYKDTQRMIDVAEAKSGNP